MPDESLIRLNSHAFFFLDSSTIKIAGDDIPGAVNERDPFARSAVGSDDARLAPLPCYIKGAGQRI